MRRLLRGSVISTGVKLASAGLSFLMVMYLARVLGAEEYGLFAAMFTLGCAGGIAALFGQHTLSIKTLAALGEAPELAPERRRILRRGFAITCAGTAVFALLVLGGGALASVFGAEIDMRYLLGACLFVLPWALAELVSQQYRAFGVFFWALAPRDVIWRGLVVLACLAAAALPFLFTDALRVISMLAVGLLGIVALQLGAMMRANRALLRADAPAPPPPTPLPWEASAWMWLASLGTMGANLNLAFAALFLPLAHVGAYFAAQKTAQLLQLPIMAINIAATPVFARLHAEGDQAGLRDIGRKLALLIVLPLACGTGIIAGFAPQLLALFDPAFTMATLALIMLAGSYLVIGLGGPTRQLMLMSDGERDVVRLTLITEGIGLALIPVLVPAFGILGAALAAVTARVLFTILTVLWCRRRLGVDTSVLALLPGAR